MKTQPGSARRLYLQLRSTMPTSPVWSVGCGVCRGVGFRADSFVQRRGQMAARSALAINQRSATQQFDCHGRNDDVPVETQAQQKHESVMAPECLLRL